MTTETVTSQLHTLISTELDSNSTITLPVHQWRDLLEFNALKIENRFLTSELNQSDSFFQFSLFNGLIVAAVSAFFGAYFILRSGK